MLHGPYGARGVGLVGKLSAVQARFECRKTLLYISDGGFGCHSVILSDSVQCRQEEIIMENQEEILNAATAMLSKVKSEWFCPPGNYVYAWFRDGEKTPFYIGRGVRERAWDKHQATVNGVRELAFCEKLRRGSWSFRVEIVRSGLSVREAIDLEKEMIREHKPCANIRHGSRWWRR